MDYEKVALLATAGHHRFLAASDQRLALLHLGSIASQSGRCLYAHLSATITVTATGTSGG